MRTNTRTRNTGKAEEILNGVLFIASIAILITLKCIFDPA